ncbi:D-aminopeptidase [Roseobacter fucihabitans]|uniref:D-aminopeptidase n=1 Tax=Roseobacter fucihabitans TaxID=1537242 RepID=A0ABZ2BU19_9RHOB|nr:serine hydrolase domain-containing protein [Roseobacter litoralis]MBC6968217.1 D-aminopeptidase [Roseobacter litoralis]
MTRIDAATIAPHLPATLGADTPGYAFALITGDDVQMQCQGMASVEHQVPITPDTAFRIASVTKEFLALIAQILYEKGDFDLHAPLSKYLPELSGVQGDVTPDQALRNRSGIRDHLELGLMAGGGLDQPVTAEQSLDMILRQNETNFAPGSDFLYSNANFLLVTRAVERATARDLGALMKEYLFIPNGMTATHYAPAHKDVIPNLAGNYIDQGDHFERAIFATELNGDGAIICTLSDLVRWYAYLRADPDGLVAQISRVTPFTNGVIGHYAMGFFNRPYLGQPTRGHNGLWPGYRTDLVMFDALDTGAICVANVNTADTTMITRKVMQSLYPGDLPVPDATPDADLLDMLKEDRTYLNSDTLESARLTPGDDGLEVEMGGWSATHKITGPAQVAFTLPGDYTHLDWSDVAQGHITLTRINGDTLTLQKLPDAPTDMPADFPGTYTCASLPATLTIDAGGQAILRGHFAHGTAWKMTLLKDDVCLIENKGGPWPRQLTIRKDNDGGRLTMSGGRAKRMEFLRMDG